MDNVSEGEDDADAETEVSEAGNKYALFFSRQHKFFKEKSLFCLHTPSAKSWISCFLKYCTADSQEQQRR